MRRKLSLLLVLTFLCTVLNVPGVVSKNLDFEKGYTVLAQNMKKNYLSKITPQLSSAYGKEARAILTSGSCPGNKRFIQDVSVYCRVSSKSSKFVLTLISPSGTIVTKECGNLSGTYRFNDFTNEDPKGQWTLIMTSRGMATTIVGTLKVNYSFVY